MPSLLARVFYKFETPLEKAFNLLSSLLHLHLEIHHFLTLNSSDASRERVCVRAMRILMELELMGAFENGEGFKDYGVGEEPLDPTRMATWRRSNG